MDDEAQELVQLDGGIAEHVADVKHAQTPDLEAVLQRLGAGAVDDLGRNLRELRRVVGDQPVAAVQQFERQFALAAARIAGDQDADREHLHEHAVQ